ncbi:hypothetical protein X798_06120 [Onchocerca flexuosa]|uniref:Uncharacterized protein n=1 Tax=Onchocerca flexuosa TaxID=387005 RepID=A0A238BN93_9BILA|nr:hypothetical protein X798_06120 [Onchocerca flexuosa]
MSMYISSVNITDVAMDTSTSIVLHKQGTFDMDDSAMYRSILVITLLLLVITVWIVIKILRIKNDEMPARRYDILSAKQLMPDNTGSEDSDDELFAPVRRDDSIRHLIPENIPQ